MTVETEEEVAALQQHLQDVIEGASFKGSYRSRQLLKYIVDQAIAGHFERLKERVIGIELWGRSPAYDTGEDSIVRVTASDVRKRLQRHYSGDEADSEFRISLPLGSYIPEISRKPYQKAARLHEAPESLASVDIFQEPVASDTDFPVPSEEPIIQAPVIFRPETLEAMPRGSRRWVYGFSFLLAINLILWIIFGFYSSRRPAAPPAILPWSAFFNSSHSWQLITSDPDVAEVEEYIHQSVSVSDYANHKYIPDPDKLKLKPRLAWLVHIILGENQASRTDVPIAMNVAKLAQENAKQISVHNARSIQFADLQTDDNFILLGSPLSNPWAGFFSDQLDFRFVFDTDEGREIIRNVHPRPHERTEYIPTALGWATGQSYAIIAFVRNPDQRGQVLLLGGASAEGTEAAAKLLMDMPRLSTVLRGCGITPTGPLQHFELLLRLNIMAGSPNNMDVEACHILPGNSTH
jgi:hypothetical protein